MLESLAFNRLDELANRVAGGNVLEGLYQHLSRLALALVTVVWIVPVQFLACGAAVTKRVAATAQLPRRSIKGDTARAAMHAKLPKAAPEAAQFFLSMFLPRGGRNGAKVATDELAPHVTFALASKPFPFWQIMAAKKAGRKCPFIAQDENISSAATKFFTSV